MAVEHDIRGPITDGLIYTVNSFHDLGINTATLGQGLEVIACSDDGNVEAVRHENFNWLGIMWHPEREHTLDEFQSSLIYNHLQVIHEINHTCCRSRNSFETDYK